jgi:hypothetical protein
MFKYGTMVHINTVGKGFMAIDDTVKIYLHVENSRRFVHLHKLQSSLLCGGRTDGEGEIIAYFHPS